MRIRWIPAGLALAALLTGRVEAAGVLVLSSGDATLDAAVVSALTGFGHTATLGPQFTAFDGTTDLTGVEAIYLQVNANWSSGDMPAAGQTQLASYVSGGGGLVTTEWLLWSIANSGSALFTALEPILPAAPTSSFNSLGSATFAVGTPNPVLNAGLPSSFSFSLTSFSGTETNIAFVQPGATVFYDSTDSGAFGLVGWDFGAGQVLNFSTTNGIDQINDPGFSRLLSNSMDWAAGVSAAAPEPGTLALAGLGLLGGVAILRRRKAA